MNLTVRLWTMSVKPEWDNTDERFWWLAVLPTIVAFLLIPSYGIALCHVGKGMDIDGSRLAAFGAWEFALVLFGYWLRLRCPSRIVTVSLVLLAALIYAPVLLLIGSYDAWRWDRQSKIWAFASLHFIPCLIVGATYGLGKNLRVRRRRRLVEQSAAPLPRAPQTGHSEGAR